jgi:hypothetical protein
LFGSRPVIAIEVPHRRNPDIQAHQEPMLPEDRSIDRSQVRYRGFYRP